MESIKFVYEPLEIKNDTNPGQFQHSEEYA